jgi:hypothetical protein
MSKKAIIAIGLALALTLAMTGPAVASDAGTQGECQSIDTLDAGELTTDRAGSVLSGDVSLQCCTTECGQY